MLEFNGRNDLGSELRTAHYRIKQAIPRKKPVLAGSNNLVYAGRSNGAHINAQTL